MQWMPKSNEKYAARLIRIKACRLCQHSGFSRSEFENIQQALWLDLGERLPRFDPRKAQLNTFVACVVDRKIVSLIRYRMAKKRSPTREECSLNDPVRDADGRIVDRHQVIEESAYDSRRRIELRLIIAELLAGVSETACQIAVARARGESIRGIATELGISPRSVRKHLDNIRKLFENAGLREYL